MHEGWDSGGICARGWSSGQLRLWLRVRTHSSPRVSGYSQEHSKRAKEHGGCSQTPFLRCNKQTETTGVWEQRRLRSAHTSTPLPTPGAEGEVCVYTGFEWPWPKERARTFTRGCGRGRSFSLPLRLVTQRSLIQLLSERHRASQLLGDVFIRPNV